MTVDAPYLTAEQIRAKVPDLAESTRWVNGDLADFVAEFEHKLEHHLGYALTPRAATDTFDADDIAGTFDAAGTHLRLTWSEVRSISSVTVDGTALDSGDWSIDKPAGVLTLRNFGLSADEVVVVYEHGLDAPPPEAKRACRLYVFHEALAESSPSNGNTYVATDPQTGVIERASTANPAEGRLTGWLDVDRIVMGMAPQPDGFA